MKKQKGVIVLGVIEFILTSALIGTAIMVDSSVKESAEQKSSVEYRQVVAE